MLYQKLRKKEKKEPQRNSVAKEYNEIKKKFQQRTSTAE